MPSDLISFPSRNPPAPSSGPGMYMRYEPGGAVRRYDYPETDLPAQPESSLDRARRIAREVEQAVAANKRLPAFQPDQAPRSLAPRCFGPGLFLVQDFARKGRAAKSREFAANPRRRLPLLAPLRAARPASILATLKSLLSELFHVEQFPGRHKNQLKERAKTGF